MPGAGFIEQVIDLYPGLIAYWDRDLRLMFAGGDRIWIGGRDLRLLVGSHMSEVLGTETFIALEPHVRRALQGARCCFERTAKKPDGSSAILAAEYLPHSVDGTVVGLVAFVREVEGPEAVRLTPRVSAVASDSMTELSERRLAERRLSMQNDISRVLAEAINLREAAPRMLAALGGAEGWDIAAVWVRSSKGDQLECSECWSSELRPELAAVVSATRELRFGVGQGGPGRVWQGGESLVIADVRTDESFVRREVARGAELTQWVGFPIRHGDEVFGVVDLLGRPRPFDGQLRDLLTAIGTQIGLFMERSRAMAEIRISEERLQTLIENLSEGLVLSNEAGVLLHWNPAARALHGLPDEENWNRALGDFQRVFELAALDGAVLPFEDWPLVRILRGESFRDYELRIRRLDSDWARVFSYGGSLVLQPDGTRLGVLTINDITERLRRDELHRASLELLAENSRIQEASRLKSEFMANMSHELRTPLNAIIGFTSLLKAGRAGAVSDTQREYLDDVLKSAQHLLQLINDVLDLAKIEAGGVILDVTEVDVQKVLAEVRNVLRGLAAQKQLELEVRVDPSLSHVHVDERMLKQILYNYLSNAIKFTPRGGRIDVEIKVETDADFRLEVRDTGIGIRERDTARLFVEFQQLNAGADKLFQGTGLGLALTKRYAEAQGGRVGVVSAPGRGSSFYVVLPRHVPSALA